MGLTPINRLIFCVCRLSNQIGFSLKMVSTHKLDERDSIWCPRVDRGKLEKLLGKLKKLKSRYILGFGEEVDTTLNPISRMIILFFSGRKTKFFERDFEEIQKIILVISTAWFQYQVLEDDKMKRIYSWVYNSSIILELI